MEPTTNEQELVWSSPEFHYVERSAKWYLVSLGVAIVVALFALYVRNFLFLLFVAIGEVTVLFIARQKPRLYGYEITNEGVSVDDRLVYRFSDLAAFAVLDDRTTGFVELVLRPKKKAAQYIKILMPRSIAVEVDRAIGSKLPEFAYEERLSEILLRRIGL